MSFSLFVRMIFFFFFFCVTLSTTSNIFSTLPSGITNEELLLLFPNHSFLFSDKWESEEFSEIVWESEGFSKLGVILSSLFHFIC